MDMNIKILWLESIKSEQIALNSNLFKELLEPKSIILNIGLLRIKLDTLIREDISKDAIGLPKSLTQVYTIPIDIPYECFIRNKEIHMGPVIAYVDRGDFKDAKNRIYFSILPKFIDYPSIKGLIIFCTPDSINVEAEIIEGYYFDPKEQEPDKIWKYGKFPFPKAIFNRSFMTQKKISIIEKKIGNTLFNSYWYNLNKWKIWQNLSQDKIVKKHLPYTEKYLGAKQLESLLNKYNSVYLKPFNKSQGIGIMKMTKARKGVFVVDNYMQRRHLKDYPSLCQFLEKRIIIPYIVQQAVPIKINNQQIDFRLVLQKDGSKKWTCSGLMARIAPKGVIITNMRGNPQTIPGREALINLYKFEEETLKKIEREMTDLIVKAVGRYEEMGMHLGDVAADIVLDSNLQIWLLELQLNQAIYGRTDLLPTEFFNKVLTNPFKYAKTLAGFNPEN